MKDTLSPAELERLLDGRKNITVLDVRRRADRVEVEHPIPGAQWKDPEQIAEWSKRLDGSAEVVVFCVHGHSVSKNARNYLREQGLNAGVLDGGIEAWQAFSKGS